MTHPQPPSPARRSPRSAAGLLGLAVLLASIAVAIVRTPPAFAASGGCAGSTVSVRLAEGDLTDTAVGAARSRDGVTVTITAVDSEGDATAVRYRSTIGLDLVTAAGGPSSWIVVDEADATSGTVAAQGGALSLVVFCSDQQPAEADPDPSATPAPDPSPSADPSTDATSDPTPDPTDDPTPDACGVSGPACDDPTPDPTVDPTPDPTLDPTSDPTTDPGGDPTSDAGGDPSDGPTADPCDAANGEAARERCGGVVDPCDGVSTPVPAGGVCGEQVDDCEDDADVGDAPVRSTTVDPCDEPVDECGDPAVVSDAPPGGTSCDEPAEECGAETGGDATTDTNTTSDDAAEGSGEDCFDPDGDVDVLGEVVEDRQVDDEEPVGGADGAGLARTGLATPTLVLLAGGLLAAGALVLRREPSPRR